MAWAGEWVVSSPAWTLGQTPLPVAPQEIVDRLAAVVPPRVGIAIGITACSALIMFLSVPQ